MKWNGLPIVIFGAGGVSVEVAQILYKINQWNPQPTYQVLGFVDESVDAIGRAVTASLNVVTCDSEFENFAKHYPVLGVVIAVGFPKVKEKIYNKICHIEHLVFPNIIHPTSHFEVGEMEMGKGNIIYKTVSGTCGIKMGDFNHFGQQVSLGHDVSLGSFNVINPQASVSGFVNIKNSCLIGTGANVLQLLNIEDRAVVGAGAVVVRDVPSDTTVVGVPAKAIRAKE